MFITRIIGWLSDKDTCSLGTHWTFYSGNFILRTFQKQRIEKSNLSSEQKSHFAMNKKYLSPSTSTLFHFTTTINRFLRRALAWCRTLWPILHLIELHSMASLCKYPTTKCLTMFDVLAQNSLKLNSFREILTSIFSD